MRWLGIVLYSDRRIGRRGWRGLWEGAGGGEIGGNVGGEGLGMCGGKEVV